ncbi:MAG: hypothetical protein ABIG84_06475 [archaeon]
MNMDLNAVFVEKRIKDVDSSCDTKVSILGTIVSSVDNSIFIDDGTGTVQGVVGQDVSTTLSQSQLVRVFGRVRPNDTGFDLYVDIIQDMSKLNLKMYNAVMGYYDKML